MRCRLCGGTLGESPRIRIAPAPSGAQDFADSAQAALARSITLEIVECAACGLVQSASAPVSYHRRAITAAGVSAAMRAHRLLQAQGLLGRAPTSSRRIVLVGCGNGYELPLLAEAGFTPEGVESGGAPRGSTGEWRIHDGYPERGKPLPGAPYDAFACYNFLEHTPLPTDFLASIGESLHANGVGIIEVPNYARQRAESRVADYVADHLSYFDERTLRAALMTSGFEILSLAAIRGGENLEAFVRWRGWAATPPRRARAASGLQREEQLLAAARDAVGRFFAGWAAKKAPAIVWGASHQALTLLAGLSGDARPRMIVDSAPFKIDRFAPASAIPIVAPTAKTVTGAGAVLIIAAGYEHEIAVNLRDSLRFAGEIWTIHGHELERLP